MSELNVLSSTEKYEYHLPIVLQGAGSSAPTVKAGGKGVSVSRTGTGAITLTFAEDPGVFVGMSPPGVTDSAGVAAASKVTAVAGAFTAATPSAQATLALTFTAETSGTYAAADLADTATAYVRLAFLREGSDL